MADNEISNKKPNLHLLRSVSKKARFVGIGIVILCVGAAILYVYHKKQAHSRPGANNKDFPVAPLIPKDKIAPPKTDYDKTIAAADKLTGSQNIEGAIKLLEPYEPTLTDPAQQYAVDVRLGTLYLRKQDYKAAVVWYEKAQQTGQPGSVNQYINIATAAEKAGDIPKAIEAYRKHIEVLKQQAGTSNADAAVKKYEDKVKSLGG